MTTTQGNQSSVLLDQSQKNSSIETEDVTVRCPRHPKKVMEYVCTNPNCHERLYCTSCLFNKEYCRHDDYIKDLSDFLDEMKAQAEHKGLSGSPEIFQVYANETEFLRQYEQKIGEQINIIAEEFDELIENVTATLNQTREQLINQLQTYNNHLIKNFNTFQHRVNQNYLQNFFQAKFKSFDDMIRNFAPYTLDSLHSMLEPLLSTYFDQYQIPEDVKLSYSELVDLQKDVPAFDIGRYGNIKKYLNIFRDKMSQSIATLINVSDDHQHSEAASIPSPTITQLNQSRRSASPFKVDGSMISPIKLKVLKKSSSQAVSLPSINLTKSVFTFDAVKIIHDEKRSKNTRSRSSIRSKAYNKSVIIESQNKSMILNQASPIKKKDVNVNKINFSASFESNHTRTIFCVLYLGNRLAATASDDGSIRIWDIISFDCLAKLTGHTAGVRQLAVTGDGYLLSASWDKSIKLWDTASIINKTDTHREIEVKENTMQASFDTEKTSTKADGSLEIYAYNVKCLKTYTGHLNSVLCVGVMGDGKTIISGSTDFTVKLWDSKSGQCLKTLTGHQSEVLCVAATKSSNMLVSGSGDKNIKVWNNEKKYNNACIKTLTGHTGFIWSLIILSDDTTVVSASLDKYIKIWDINTGDCLKTLIGHYNQILNVKQYGADMLASCDSDGNIKIWSISNKWQPLTTLKRGEGKVAMHGLDVTEDLMLVTAGVDRKISIWN